MDVVLICDSLISLFFIKNDDDDDDLVEFDHSVSSIYFDFMLISIDIQCAPMEAIRGEFR